MSVAKLPLPILGLLFIACFSSAESSSAEVDFTRDVQPLLRRHCDRCHGDSNQEAGLTLASSAALLGTADSDEPIVAAGDPAGSLLFSRVADPDAGDLMPLDAEPLSNRDIQTLKQWIAEGAKLPTTASKGGESGKSRHWAYQRPVRPSLVSQEEAAIDDWERSDIDRFVINQMQTVGLRPSPLADPATLARRVSLVLTGLPATPKQMDLLEHDPSERAYENLVNELMSSSAFGQHWARHWLDLARYADSNGYQADQLRDAWAYRDWVVDAFNGDMPYDQFVTEQIAGDLLPDATTQTRIATGLHRTPTCNVEAGVHPEANRVAQVFDRVNTTATVFLGATMECAQCHDHKYDPFTQVDYYRLFAYFNNTPLEVEKVSGVQYDFIGPDMSLPMLPEQQREFVELEQRRTQLINSQEALSARNDFEAWLTNSREALTREKPHWVTPTPNFQSTGGESFTVLDDGSVVLSGDLPGPTIYRFRFDNLEQPIIGIRVDALRDDSLPGGGPGRGDEVRTNFVLHDVTAKLISDDAERELTLTSPEASFSQKGWPISGAIDGNSKTGWGIAPKFTQSHWATFAVQAEPKNPSLAESDSLVVELDQHYGSGRVIGRAKVSLRVGPEAARGLNDEIVQLLTRDEKLTKSQRKKLRDYHASRSPEVVRIQKQLAEVDTKLKAIKPPTTLVMVEQEQPRQTHVMIRGEYDSLGEEVQPGTPASLHPLNPELPPNRLGLAAWLVDPQNPLLARVTVNRFWKQIYGRGIVSTPEDFGTQSEPPTHPELLDWLACEFQSNGWSVKHLIRQIVLSSTFRQDSRVTKDHLQLDPENKWLARGPRYRMPAEMVRDNALAVSGLLCQTGGGSPIMPYQPTGIWRAVGRNQPKWVAQQDANRYRRGLYVVWKRGAPYPSFVAFDAPDRASCTVKRPRTNTPLQALVLLNDRAYGEAALGLAQRMLDEASAGEASAVVRHGFRLATGKAPAEETENVLLQLFESEQQRVRQDRSLIDKRISLLPKNFRKQGLNEEELAAWFPVASVLLNLDSTITVN